MAARGPADTRTFLASKRVTLEAAADLEQHQYHVAGLLLLVNLCARLYPEIHVIAPSRIADECRVLAMQVNPQCDVVTEPGGTASARRDSAGVVCWATARSRSDAVVVAPVGWDVVIDEPEAMHVRSTNILTALAAAAIAASELFRHVFAEFLPRGRSAPLPARFNVLTSAPGSGGAALPDLPSDIALGRVHLVGAGAIGQAAVYALARVSATGTVTVVDPEAISESNLQRYVLTMDADVGSSKCALVQRALGKTRVEAVLVEAEWSVDHPETRNAQVVCAAVDTATLRIAIQASLPARVYNAWTQPDDLGWSRHERFSDEPCLACLYWPTRPRPSYHELVGAAIKQHELRVLAYVVSRVPVDTPLLLAQIPKLPGRELPAESGGWTQRSLLDDVAGALGVDPESVRRWKGRELPDLYRDGICGGALVRTQSADVPEEMVVPLAHQSVLAGIMLATQVVVAARPELRAHRSAAIESRLDLLSGFPQVAPRPRRRTPTCFCEDADFVRRYLEKWPHMVAPAAGS